MNRLGTGDHYILNIWSHDVVLVSLNPLFLLRGVSLPQRFPFRSSFAKFRFFCSLLSRSVSSQHKNCLALQLNQWDFMKTNYHKGSSPPKILKPSTLLNQSSAILLQPFLLIQKHNFSLMSYPSFCSWHLLQAASCSIVFVPHRKHITSPPQSLTC
jgi:hypothetical protein